MMTEWYQKAINALQLNGLGERTQEAYVRALRMLCEFYHKTPEDLGVRASTILPPPQEPRSLVAQHDADLLLRYPLLLPPRLEARLAHARSGPRKERATPARRVVPRGGAHHPRLRPHTA